jgi:hypothetical protein
MLRSDSLEWQWQWAGHPLARAFAISVAIHLFFFSGLELCNRFDLWRFTPFAFLTRSLRIAPVRPQPAIAAKQPAPPPKPAEVKELPLVFLDVDPSQAAPEAPPDTKYYSAVNTKAGNPDVRREAEKPKIEGKQDKVPKTADLVKATPPPQPLQPAPPPKVEPPPPKIEPPPPKPEPVVVKPEPVVAKVEPTPPPKPAERGDLEPIKQVAAAKPAPVVPKAVPAPSPPPAPAVEPPPARARPRTVAQAQAQQGADSPSALQGEKMQQEGGVRRFSIAATPDSRGTPLGSYDARFIQAVQKCWYALLEEQRFGLDRMGKVVLDFRLTYDGRITNLNRVESSVGELYSALCELAITKPAPFEKWPPEIRRLIGANYREVRFTFYY